MISLASFSIPTFFKRILFVALILNFITPNFSQVTNYCTESENQFQGAAEETLCESIGDLTYPLEIGTGTAYTYSSQLSSNILSGNVAIIGNFYINTTFTFQNANVKITSGKTILVSNSSTQYISQIFTIDNSKLFACDNLWNGIVMGNYTTISTKNNSIIEDASVAISASNTSKVVLSVNNTIFNRNNIGIQLTQVLNVTNGIIVSSFRNNKFTCTAPLNGTTDEITYVGIKTLNVPFSFKGSPANRNLFSRIQNGIISQGNQGYISISFAKFLNIREDGIYIKSGPAFLDSLFFYNCEKHAINIQKASVIEARKISYILTDNIPNYNQFLLPRYGINIYSFEINSKVYPFQYEMSI